jgi:hypothetical protein
MEAFQKTLEECRLTDLGFYGPKYTWRNCREGEDFIKERLDRGMTNQAWRDIFPSQKLMLKQLYGQITLPSFCISQV